MNTLIKNCLVWTLDLSLEKKFKGLSIIKFEDILRKFAGQVIMNVHVKSLDGPYDYEIMRKIVANIRKYDCANQCVFSCMNLMTIFALLETMLQISMCVWDMTKIVLGTRGPSH